MKKAKLKVADKKAIVREKKSKLDLIREKLLKNTLLPEEKEHLNFVNSGSWALNLALTSNINTAYPIGRVINPVGDFSVGKTLMACELVNSLWYIEHLMNKKKVKLYYDEPEFAFDLDLGKSFNMPLPEIIGLRERLPGFKLAKGERPFHTSKTAEDMYRNLMYISETESKNYDIVLYVIDSLDSLSDAREIEHIEKKGVDKQDYGGGKARVLSQMFRNCIEGIHNSNVILYIVSQIRTNFGVTFGNKYSRSGGKALDHYASQIFWMNEIKKITHKDTKMNQGIEVELNITKNKVGERYNRLRFNILSGYGVDNVGSAVDFLLEYGIIKMNGAYVNWKGDNIYKEELIQAAIEDPTLLQELKDMMQRTWLNLLEESRIKRPTKWGEGQQIV
jgi:RecA/RadA recombinase